MSSFKFVLWNCGGTESFRNAVVGSKDLMKKAYGWMHTCISYDFYNKSLSVAIDQQVVHTEVSNDPFAFQSIRVSWNYNSTVPETFTLLNIYTRSEKLNSVFIELK